MSKTRAQAAKGEVTMEELRTIFECPSCVGDSPVRLYLPESGVEAYSAKLRDSATGAAFVATVRADRSVATERDLIEAERAAHAAKYGKLEKSVHAIASSATAGTKVPVRIAIAMPTPVADKAASSEAQAALMAAHRSNVAVAGGLFVGASGVGTTVGTLKITGGSGG